MLDSHNIVLAIQHLRAMQQADGVDRSQYALNAMLAALAAVDDGDYGPYAVLVALLSHITGHQINRLETLRFILQGVVKCWHEVDQDTINEIMAEIEAMQGGVVRH